MFNHDDLKTLGLNPTKVAEAETRLINGTASEDDITALADIQAMVMTLNHQPLPRARATRFMLNLNAATLSPIEEAA